MENKKVLLSIRDLHVKFSVRGRTLTAIRGVSLDLYENESVAIVGESGSGKSVLTKTFAGMLDSNGYISQGDLMFNDAELSDTRVALTAQAKRMILNGIKKLNAYSKLELGASVYRQILDLEAERRHRSSLTEDEEKRMKAQLDELIFKKTEKSNQRQTVDRAHEKEKYKAITVEIEQLEAQIKALNEKKKAAIAAAKQSLALDTAYQKQYQEKMAALKAECEKQIGGEVPAAAKERNAVLAKEVYLSVGRYSFKKRLTYFNGLLKALKKAMKMGVDLDNEQERNAVFDNVVFRVEYLDETETELHGQCKLNLSKIKYAKDWSKIRGTRIATVFQDPMTSLNPIVTIGKQITSIILKHQDCSEVEARRRALVLMKKVGIPNAEKRFDDYPFQYSGGMRQRIVIAIALCCQPKILICDEPTTALDVTIQAQILKLLKDLQKEFNYTIVFITHDLGVVANIADRVAVLYAGQVVELGTVEDVFYDSRHPYTWALLSSLPQLAQRNTKLYSISGTPPSLYNKIVGDAFAPRNPYCLKVDTLKEPPMFRVSDTHYAKTWLLDPRAPKMEKPEIIQNIHEKLMKVYNV
ncbi:MAG: ATP-binding cassette domain-containing protein [Clostridia bacterium]|nr:ATP-binding cassette domain-containing protein [Clostridia bacterium]